MQLITHGTGLIDLQLEDHLLLCCARVYMDAGHADALKRLIEHTRLDWEKTLQSAEKHKVLPLVYHHLNQICPASVPPDVLAQLQAGFQANSWRTLFLMDDCLKIGEVLSQHGVAAAPIKGPVLAKTLYGDPVLRTFDDLDFLVDARDLALAGRLVTDMGFPEYKEANKKYHLVFINSSHKLVVELHFRLAYQNWTSLAVQDVLGRTRIGMVAGTPVRLLDPADLLIYLCLHGAKHSWYQLRWVCDVAEFLRVYHDLDWDYLMVEATRLRHRRILLVGVYLAHQLLDAPLPDAIIDLVHSMPIIRELTRRAQAELFWEYASPVIRTIKPYFTRSQIFDSSYARIRMSLADLAAYVQPRPGDHDTFRLPPGLAFLYYPLRLFRLLKLYRTTIFTKVIHNFRSMR